MTCFPIRQRRVPLRRAGPTKHADATTAVEHFIISGFPQGKRAVGLAPMAAPDSIYYRVGSRNIHPS